MEPPTKDGMTDNQPLDPQLFEKFRKGDHGAMCEIVRRFHKRLIAFIRVYTRQREIAEEVAQEVFLAAYRQRTEIRTPEGLRPWLFTVAKRMALKARNRKENQLWVSLESDEFEDLGPSQLASQGKQVELSQLGASLQTAMQELNPRDRELVLLRFYGGLQVKEISVAMDIPMGSVGVFLNRSLTKIRTLLEKQGIRSEDFVEI